MEEPQKEILFQLSDEVVEFLESGYLVSEGTNIFYIWPFVMEELGDTKFFKIHENSDMLGSYTKDFLQKAFMNGIRKYAKTITVDKSKDLFYKYAEGGKLTIVAFSNLMNELIEDPTIQ